MRIENNLTDYQTPISTIKDGECFIYNEMLHMRVNIGSIDRKDEDKFPVVIVNLEKNRLNSLRSDVKVRKIDAKIVVGES